MEGSWVVVVMVMVKVFSVVQLRVVVWYQFGGCFLGCRAFRISSFVVTVEGAFVSQNVGLLWLLLLLILILMLLLRGDSKHTHA